MRGVEDVSALANRRNPSNMCLKKSLSLGMLRCKGFGRAEAVGRRGKWTLHTVLLGPPTYNYIRQIRVMEEGTG